MCEEYLICDGDIPDGCASMAGVQNCCWYRIYACELSDSYFADVVSTGWQHSVFSILVVLIEHLTPHIHGENLWWIGPLLVVSGSGDSLFKALFRKCVLCSW